MLDPSRTNSMGRKEGSLPRKDTTLTRKGEGRKEVASTLPRNPGKAKGDTLSRSKGETLGRARGDTLPRGILKTANNAAANTGVPSSCGGRRGASAGSAAPCWCVWHLWPRV